MAITHTRRGSKERGRNYVIRDRGLEAAINAALVLGKPLLLTGEPGTGKTQLADRIAWFLRLPDPLLFETRSSSTARDLFYTYDALGRFQAGADHSAAQSRATSDYLSFNALGKAILATRNPEEFPQIPPRHFESPSERRVVVIDEVDKAHRDFPNDLLSAIDRVAFSIPELKGLEIAAAPDLRPIVVITSNSEKNLPDAFLRRCVYHNILFPKKPEELVEILNRQIDVPFSSPLLESCVNFFLALRARALRKKPSTAELVDWVRLVERAIARRRSQGGRSPLGVKELTLEEFQSTQGALVKLTEDLQELGRAWDEFEKPATLKGG